MRSTAARSIASFLLHWELSLRFLVSVLQFGITRCAMFCVLTICRTYIRAIYTLYIVIDDYCYYLPIIRCTIVPRACIYIISVSNTQIVLSQVGRATGQRRNRRIYFISLAIVFVFYKILGKRMHLNRDAFYRGQTYRYRSRDSPWIVSEMFFRSQEQQAEWEKGGMGTHRFWKRARRSSFTFRDAVAEAVVARLAVGSFLQRANRKVGCEERSALQSCAMQRLHSTFTAYACDILRPCHFTLSVYGKTFGKQRLRQNEFRCFIVMACLSAP